MDNDKVSQHAHRWQIGQAHMTSPSRKHNHDLSEEPRDTITALIVNMDTHLTPPEDTSTTSTKATHPPLALKCKREIPRL